MIIPINNSLNSSNPKLPPGLARISHDEVVLIELQGSIEVECKQVEERDGKLVGKLKLDNNDEKPTLQIGHHLLEGKIASLTKPLAVVQRCRKSVPIEAQVEAEDGPEFETMDIDDDDDIQRRQTVEWNIIAVVKRKIVFSKRPMPVVHLK